MQPLRGLETQTVEAPGARVAPRHAPATGDQHVLAGRGRTPRGEALRLVHVEHVRRLVDQAARKLFRERMRRFEARYGADARARIDELQVELETVKKELESAEAAAALLDRRVKELEAERVRLTKRNEDLEQRNQALERVRKTAQSTPHVEAVNDVGRRAESVRDEAEPPSWVQTLCARVAMAAARGAAEGVTGRGLQRLGEGLSRQTELLERVLRLEQALSGRKAAQTGAPGSKEAQSEQTRATNADVRRQVDPRRTALLRKLAKANVDLRKELGIEPRGGR